MKWGLVEIFLVILLWIPPNAGLAEILTLNPVADATLIEVAPNNSSGGQTFFNAGTTQNLTRNRGLLRFDIGAAVPADAMILSATLDLQVLQQGVDGQADSLFGVHRVLQSWGEGVNVATDNGGGRGAPANPGDATWLYSHYASGSWNAPGGAAGKDFVSAFSSSALVSGLGTYNFESTMDTTADVQLWLNHPEANFGWMLISESENTAFTARRFASREDLSGGPMLTLEYTLVPEPSLCLLVAAGLASGLLFSRVKRR